LFKEQPSGESEIEEVVEKIKDERKKSDVKGQVILEELDSEPSSNAPKIMCSSEAFLLSIASRTLKRTKVREALERGAAELIGWKPK